MKNAGDSKVGRMKAAITRRTRAGIKPVTSPTPMVATKISEPTISTPDALKPKVMKTRKYRFMGSMKFGGHIKKTGLYLMHEGEHVKSPYNRRNGMVK